MTKSVLITAMSALAIFSLDAADARVTSAVEKGVLVVRGPGEAPAARGVSLSAGSASAGSGRSVENQVRVWRGEPTLAPQAELAGADAPRAAPAGEKLVVIQCGRGLNHVRTQGFYSGLPGRPSRRFTQGFYSGGPDYRRCVRIG